MPFHVEAFNTVARSALLKIGNLKTGPFYFSTLNIKAESFTINRAPLAQWIEHRPSKPRVVGSNPTGRATTTQDITMLDQLMIIGYWSAAAGIILCAIGYFVFPAMLRLLTTGEDE